MTGIVLLARQSVSSRGALPSHVYVRSREVYQPQVYLDNPALRVPRTGLARGLTVTWQSLGATRTCGRALPRGYVFQERQHRECRVVVTLEEHGAPRLEQPGREAVGYRKDHAFVLAQERGHARE